MAADDIKLVLRMPRELHEVVSLLAKEDGRSLNSYICARLRGPNVVVPAPEITPLTDKRRIAEAAIAQVSEPEITQPAVEEHYCPHPDCGTLLVLIERGANRGRWGCQQCDKGWTLGELNRMTKPSFRSLNA
jgi:Arc-like DNA binding domain